MLLCSWDFGYELSYLQAEVGSETGMLGSAACYICQLSFASDIQADKVIAINWYSLLR